MKELSAINTAMGHMTRLKIIGLLLVIVGHSTHVYTGGWIYTSIVTSFLFKIITGYIYSFHMPLFVFISGYLYSYGRLELGKYNHNWNFVKSKAKRVLVPYLMMGIFYVIPIRILLNDYPEQSIWNLIAMGILLSKNAGHLWFLLMLFNLFLVFRLFEPMIVNYKWYVIFFIFFVLHLNGHNIPNVFQLQVTSKFLIYFYLGYLFIQKQDDIKRFLRLGYGWVYFVFHLTLLGGVYYMTTFLQIPGNHLLVMISRFILAVLGIAFTYIFSWHLEFTKKNILYDYLDQYNFSIYLFHEPIIFIILNKLAYSTIEPFILVSICFFSSMGISIILSKVTAQNGPLRVFTGQ